MILDSGARRSFGTGAVRDIAEGKGRMDLVPLSVVHQLTGWDEFGFIEEYIRKGDTDCLNGAINVFVHEHSGLNDMGTAILEVSKHFEAGCQKYGDRNWEKGIPLHCYIDSASRHLIKFYRGDKDENHHLAFLWNLMCAIWTHENKPELIDLPFKENKSQFELGTHEHGAIPSPIGHTITRPYDPLIDGQHSTANTIAWKDGAID
jgi:hypothetical protein